MLNYKKYTSPAGQDFIIATDEDGLEKHIPMDETNSDYQAYLDRDNPKAALSTPIISGDE